VHINKPRMQMMQIPSVKQYYWLCCQLLTLQWIRMQS